MDRRHRYVDRKSVNLSVLTVDGTSNIHRFQNERKL